MTAFQARAEFDNINTHGASVVTPYETINLHKVLGYGLWRWLPNNDNGFKI